MISTCSIKSTSPPLSPLFLTPVSADSPLVSLVLPGQFSTVGRPASSSAHHQKNTEEEVEEQEKGEVREEAPSSSRRIRAPRGEGMSSLMASLTSSPLVSPCHDRSSSEVHSLPRLATNSSLNSEVSCNSASYGTLSASSSCCQVSLGEINVAGSSVTRTKSKLYVFLSGHRIRRVSPATSSPCCPLTPPPESFLSLLPPPPLLFFPTPSPPPAQAPPAVPCSQSGLTQAISP